MPGTTLIVTEVVGRKLRELAAKTGRPVDEVLERAVEEYHRQQFWAAVDAGYAALRADPNTWDAEQAERNEWDGTLADGLDQAEQWGDEGSPLPPGNQP
ncbi:MAG TPA: hypothetical protein VM597_16445 [Gemmataceae bacterium]|jgi:hypothetical protein|nr:hypothetical protein [Gemmataceae bacterium]